MQHSPFQWPEPVDESRPEGGVFYGDSISRRWTSKEKPVVRPSRAQALEVLQDWFRGATRKVPHLLGPYGIGKTSVLNYAIQSRIPGESPTLIEIGVHDCPFSVTIKEFAEKLLADQFSDKFLARQFEGHCLKEIQNLVWQLLDPAVDAHRLTQEILECTAVPKDSELNRIALLARDDKFSDPWMELAKSVLRFCSRPLALRHLMKASRVDDGSERINYFCKWARVHSPPPVVLVYVDSTLPVTEGLNLTEGRRFMVPFGLLEKQSVLFLFEQRNLEPLSGDDALLAKDVRQVRVPALHPQEALDCICGYHDRAQSLGSIQPPRFCPEGHPLSEPGWSCSKSPQSCRTARSVLNQTGPWPFLLQAVCSYWDERYGEGVQRLEECLRELKPRLWGHIDQWWSTLPEEERRIFLSLLEGKSGLTQYQYRRLSELGMAFKLGKKGRWRIPNLLKDWWRQSMKAVIKLDRPANDEVITELKKVLSSGQALAFIGNGCSIPIGYPSWRRLIYDLLDLCSKRQPPRASDFEQMKGHPSPPFVADQCKDVLGDEYYDFLSKEFGSRSPAFGAEHHLLWRLFRQFLTSNYDPCLEHAFAEIYNSQADYFSYTNVDRMARFPQEASSRKQVVFHVHGYHDRPKECILTEHDYQAHYQDQGFLTTSTTLFQAHPVVFIGFSLEDELMGIPRRLKSIFQGPTGPHFAVLPYPTDPKPWIKRQELQKKYRIKAVFYPVTGSDHSARLRLLQSLIPPSATRMPSPSPPPGP